MKYIILLLSMFMVLAATTCKEKRHKTDQTEENRPAEAAPTPEYNESIEDNSENLGAEDDPVTEEEPSDDYPEPE